MRIDVYVGEAPDEGDGYGGATETSAKVGIGTLRKSEQSDPPKRRGEPMADPDTRSPFWDTPEGQRILDKPVKKYSENQPRDWHGRFGSGTGDMPDHVKFLVDRAAKFYAAGGTIKKASDMEVPELNSVQRTFTVQSDDVRDGVSIGQSVKSEDERARLEDGCQFAAGALHDALKTTYDYDALIAYDGGGRPCAAISFHLPVSQSANPSIEIGVLGSNKTVDGAACALQCELAGIASSMNSSVVSMFTDDSRAYHMLIGRQLSGHQSTWTNEQCAKIASAKIPLTNKSVIGTIRKYAEDQPRDDHGRFSTEGSTATGTERSTPMSWQTTGDGSTNFGVGEGWMLRNIDVVHTGLGFVHEESRHDLPADEEFAVNRYILGAAYSMNNGLRGGKSLDSVPYARDIQNAISKSSTSKDVTVFRGGVSDSGAIPDNVQVGDVVEDRGFVSTSMTELTAKNFGDGSDPVEIHVPAGSNAIGCATSEQEVLLGSGSQFRIDSMPPHGKWQMTYVGLSGSTEQASKKMVKSTGGGEEQQQQSRFTWQPGDVTVVRKDTGKISVGTLRKDRVSGETQPHGAHGHFASGGEGSSQASERTRLGRLRDRLSGGRSHQPQSEIGQARYPSPKPTKDVSYFKEHIGEIADRAYPPGSLPLGITPSFKDGVDAYMSSESSAQQKAEGNKLLKEMVDEQWPGGGKATVLNPEEFKQYVREENATVFYRGFHTHPDYGDSTEVRIAKGDAKFTEFVNGDRVGLGTLLHGTYFGEKAIAVDYAKTQVGSARQSEVLDPARSRVVQAVLKPDARVATITQSSLGMASSLAQELGHLADPDGSRKIASTQASNIAAEYIAKGFDAVRVKNANLSGGDAGTYTVVFNTGALIVAGDNGTSIRR